MFELKVASIKDILDIQNVAKLTWPDTFKEVMPKEQIDYMLGLMYNQSILTNQMVSGHNFILLKHNNNLVGFTSYELNHNRKPVLMIHKVYVLPISQGLGIGKRTLDYLTLLALKNQQKKLKLKVFHKNHEAIRFYEKNGFKNKSVEEKHIGNNYIISDYVMVKTC